MKSFKHNNKTARIAFIIVFVFLAQYALKADDAKADEIVSSTAVSSTVSDLGSSIDSISNNLSPLDIASTSSVVTATTTATTTATSTIKTPPVKATSSYMLIGKASWYAYKGGMFAASPEFPKGSLIKVISVANPTKQIVVTINDYGPDRKVHPDRVIDLDKVAFAKLAPLGAGVISVRVEPVMIVTSSARVISVSAATDNSIFNSPLKVYQTNNKLALTSAAGIVLNAKTGKVIWQKNPNAQLPIASLTKIVAAKVFMDTNPNLNKVVTYRKADEEKNYEWADKGSIARLKVSEGEKLTVRDLLYSSLLGSANNAVESMVRVSGLTRTQFIARMNSYVKKIGATQTHFDEPTGLAPTNVSSVRDYAIISRKALTDGHIAKVTSVQKYTFRTVNTKRLHTIKNTNKLVLAGSLKITGSKTGYLDEAKYCLMTRSKSSRGEVIAVTFGTPDKWSSFDETKKLINYGFSKL